MLAVNSNGTEAIIEFSDLISLAFLAVIVVIAKIASVRMIQNRSLREKMAGGRLIRETGTLHVPLSRWSAWELSVWVVDDRRRPQRSVALEMLGQNVFGSGRVTYRLDRDETEALKELLYKAALHGVSK